MARLEMHLDGRLLDSAAVSPVLIKTQGWALIKVIKAELIQKHKNTLSTTGQEPVFVLAGMPSCINNFEPLPRL